MTYPVFILRGKQINVPVEDIHYEDFVFLKVGRLDFLVNSILNIPKILNL